MSTNDNPAPHHEDPVFGNPDLPAEGMTNTVGDPASARMTRSRMRVNTRLSAGNIDMARSLDFTAAT